MQRDFRKFWEEKTDINLNFNAVISSIIETDISWWYIYNGLIEGHYDKGRVQQMQKTNHKFSVVSPAM